MMNITDKKCKKAIWVIRTGTIRSFDTLDKAFEVLDAHPKIWEEDIVDLTRHNFDTLKKWRNHECRLLGPATEPLNELKDEISWKASDLIDFIDDEYSFYRYGIGGSKIGDWLFGLDK